VKEIRSAQFRLKNGRFIPGAAPNALIGEVDSGPETVGASPETALAVTTRYGANGGLSVAKYAEHIGRGRNERSIHNEIWAWEVYESAP
jgi:hypothetical protein